jgi:hypothetical protein
VLAGSRPGGRASFFCSAKRKNPKKRRPYSAAFGFPQENGLKWEVNETRFAQTTFTSLSTCIHSLAALCQGLNVNINININGKTKNQNPRQNFLRRMAVALLGFGVAFKKFRLRRCHESSVSVG